MNELINGGDTERYGSNAGFLWTGKTAKVLSPVTGGLLGSVYALAAFAGTYQGWYWYELQQLPIKSFTASPVVVGICLAVGALFGGGVAGLFAEAASPVAAVLVPAPFIIGAIVLVGSGGQIQTRALWILIAYILVLLVSSGVGVLVGTKLQPEVNKPTSPAGIWWPHWLYFPVVAYYFPIYAIATLTNIWLDIRLALRFTFNPRMWFWWKTWVYAFFLSWFAAVPTYILFVGYARLLDRMQIDSGVAPQGKFNAFFLYFLTVPTLAWFLTFAWRWAVASLFKGG